MTSIERFRILWKLAIGSPLTAQEETRRLQLESKQDKELAKLKKEKNKNKVK